MTCPATAPLEARAWVGAVVPKRHARRAVTRSLIKRQIYAAAERHRQRLGPGLWIVRLRSPFDRSRFVSAASQAMRVDARAELESLLEAAVDLGTTAMSSWPRRALIALVRSYRFALSPWLGNACRFEPTCSAYALGALEAHGAAAGVALALGRIARCHPWCAGGFDPVPAAPPRLFTSLLGRAARDRTPSRLLP